MKELSQTELRELRAWQRRMVTVFVIAMLALLAVVAPDLVFGLSRKLPLVVFIALGALACLGFVIQFSQRCPRCGYRLGFQSRLLLPAHCRKCGVGLKPKGQ